MERKLPDSQVYVAILVGSDGTWHMLPSPQHMIAECGEAEGVRRAPAWVSKRVVCQRCLQKRERAILGVKLLW